MLNPKGGTEILYENLAKRVDLTWVNLIKSICAFELLDRTKPNILWQHLSYDQDNVKLLSNPDYVKHLDAIVFVSHWQHEKFRRMFPLDNVPCYVIQNCIEPIAAHEKPEKIRLIYTSTPWRGLHLLAEAYAMLDRDVELIVFSGTSIYGNQFYNQANSQYQPLYDRLKSVGATHIEYAPNSEVVEVLKQSHILAYPNCWEETSCLAAIEALAAGCKVVTTNFGALPETCGTWADYTPLGYNFLERYVESLRNAIDTYDKSRLQKQQQYYNENWTWNTRIKEWERLIDSFKLRKQVQAA